MRTFLPLVAAVALFCGLLSAGEVTDSTDAGAGSLRGQIGSANPGDTITFRPGVGTANVANTAITVATSNLTVRGNWTLTATQAKLGVVETIEDYIAAKNWAGLAAWMAPASGFEAALQAEITSGAGLNVVSTLTIIDGNGPSGTERSEPVFLNSGFGNGFSLSRLAFINVDYKSTANLEGGGVVSASSATRGVTLGAMDTLYFNKVTVTVGDTNVDDNGLLYGGGVVGAYASGLGSDATVSAVSGSSFAGTSLNFSGTGNNSGLLYGGGVLGAYSIRGTSAIGRIADTRVEGVAVTVTNDVRGGGAVGAFNNLNFTIDGSDIITGTNDSASLAGISRSTFTGIRIDAERDVYAGVVYSSGLANRLTVSNSLFVGNSATALAGGRVHAGAIGIDTIYATDHPDGHAVTLTAGTGGVTRFAGNAIVSGTASRTGSVHFGRMNTGGGYTGTNTQDYRNAPHSRAHARLDVTPSRGGWVDLRDPVTADLRGQRTGEYVNPADVTNTTSTTLTQRATENTTHRFAMTLGGLGRIHWGGKNDLFADGGSTVSFRAGPAVTLLGDFQLNNAGVAHVADVTNGVVDAVKRDLSVEFAAGSGFTLDLTSRRENLAVFAKGAHALSGDVALDGSGMWTRSSSASPRSPGAG